MIKLGVAEVPWHHLGGAVHTHVIAQLREQVLIIVHAIGGMQVERHFQSILMHPCDESLRVWNGGAVPCPSGPPLRMPVHVENHHVHGYVVAFHIIYNLHEFVGRVALVLAIPISQHIERRHGLSSCYLDEIAQCLFVLVAISHEVPVDCIFVHGFCHPFYAVIGLVEGEGGGAIAPLRFWRLVDDAPSCPREQSVFHFHTFVVANLSIECPCGAFQVHGIVFSRIPQHLSPVHVERYGEHLVGWRGIANLPSQLIFQCQDIRFDIEISVFSLRGELRHWQIPVYYGKRRPVFKQRLLAVLYSYHLGGKNGESGIPLGDHRIWVCHGIALGLGES